MQLAERLKLLTEEEGLSSRETSAASMVQKILKEMEITSYIDGYGNVHGFLPAEEECAKTVLLEAHIDQIGLMVSGIDEKGYLKFVNLGGVDERILYGMEVMVLTDPPLYGVIGGFLPKKKEKEEAKNASVQDLRIDIGFSREESVKKVHVGDYVRLKGNTCSLLGNRISGAAMDNRAGMVAILSALEQTRKLKRVYHADILFSTQEELGLHGAYTGVEADKTDFAISVDVTHGETPDSSEITGVFPLGCGAVICRGPNFKDDYTQQLIHLAKEKNVSHEIEVASGGSGTTAWAIQTIGSGIPVMLVSIPLRYMHTNVETLDIRDVQAVSDLLAAVLTGGMNLDE